MKIQKMHKELGKIQFSKEGRERRKEKHMEKVIKWWESFIKYYDRTRVHPHVTRHFNTRTCAHGKGNNSIPLGYDAGETAKERKEK